MLRTVELALRMFEREATAFWVVDEHAARHPGGPPAGAIWEMARPGRCWFDGGSLSRTAVVVRETRRERQRLQLVRLAVMVLLGERLA
jgi:hypothetical protein